MTSSFLLALDRAPLPALSGCVTVTCRYNVREYRDHLFYTYRIPLDECLNRALPKRRAEFLAGRLCAREALSLAGSSECCVSVGKARSPVFPPPFLGSISHTNDSAVCTIASRPRCIALGIDEEVWIEPSTALKIEGQILNKREHFLCMHLPLDFAQALTICFSAKESFFKAYYSRVGRYFGFDEAEVSHIDVNGNHGVLRLEPCSAIAPCLPGLAGFDIAFTMAPDRVLTYHHLFEA